jgi:tetratricopeptide (TPR) repeat protein/DNA-binding XRE family transcriptional regulator
MAGDYREPRGLGAAGEETVFGKRLSGCRRSAGLTQQELADRSGLSVRAISNLELGSARSPHAGTAHRLADALGLHGESRAGFLTAAGRRLGGGVAGPLPAEQPAQPGRGLVAQDGLAPAAGPATPPAVVPRQLPAAVPDFTGRVTELAALNTVLDAARPGRCGGVAVVAIDGPPGVGKTTLAVRWAHQAAARFPDGQLYVNLRGFGPWDELMPAGTAICQFLDALGIPAQQIPPDPESQAGLYRSLLAGKQVLIVADNACDAEQVRPLLPGSPGCMVLVTSRNRLIGLAAAHAARLISLDVLPDDEAHQLLTRRIGADRARTEPDAIGQLAQLCGRLPLALAVAAARAAARPASSLAALAADLAGTPPRLGALHTGDPGTDVRTVFSWSCQHLAPQPARLFRLLGIQPGPDITIPASAALLGIRHDDARAALDALAVSNLIDEHAPGRYCLHDLIRAYAADQAAVHESQTERETAIQRMLDYYLHTSHAAAMLLDPSREPVTLSPPLPGVTPEPPASSQHALAWFEAEHRGLTAAITAAYQTGSDAHAWQLPWAMDNFLNWRGYWPEWAAAQRTALAAATRLGDVAGQATARRLLAHTFARSGDYTRACALLTQCLGLYRQLGDQIGQGRVHQTLGWIAERQSRKADALGHAEQALALYVAAGDQARQAAGLNNVGWCLVLAGNYQRARAICKQALALHRELGHRRGEASSWDSLGYAEHKLGNLVEAAECHRRALNIVRELGDRYEEAEFLTHLGDVWHTAGDRREAQAAWQQALTILEDLHHPDSAQVHAKLRQQDCPSATRSPDTKAPAT